jgi:hypothetical protein
LSAFKRIIFHLFISLCYYCAIIIIIIIIPGWALPDPEAYNIHRHRAWEGRMDGLVGWIGWSERNRITQKVQITAHTARGFLLLLLFLPKFFWLLREKDSRSIRFRNPMVFFTVEIWSLEEEENEGGGGRVRAWRCQILHVIVFPFLKTSSAFCRPFNVERLFPPSLSLLYNYPRISLSFCSFCSTLLLLCIPVELALVFIPR